MPWIREKRFEIIILSLVALGIASGGALVFEMRFRSHSGDMPRPPEVVQLAGAAGKAQPFDFLPVDEVRHPDVFVERQSACLYDRNRAKSELIMRKRNGKPICNPAYLPNA